MRTIDETLADTVESVDAADVTEDGSGFQPCEADPEDEVTYAGVRITVANDQIDATVDEAWAYWVDIGFEAASISSVLRSPTSTRGGTAIGERSSEIGKGLRVDRHLQPVCDRPMTGCQVRWTWCGP